MADSPQGVNRLDSPPPAPSGMVRRVPDSAPASIMAGGGMDAGSQNTLPQSIIQWGSSAEDSLTAISKAAPSLTAPLAGIIDQLRQIVGGFLQSGGTAQPQAPQGLSGILAQAAPTPGMPQGPPPPLPAAGAA